MGLNCPSAKLADSFFSLVACVLIQESFQREIVINGFRALVDFSEFFYELK